MSDRLLFAGGRVLLVGLKQDTKYNGLSGTVDQVTQNSVYVRLDSDEIVQCSHEHLIRCETPKVGRVIS